MIGLTLAASAGCGGSTTPPDAYYPPCSAASEQCLDHLQLAPGLGLPFYRNFALTTANPAITEAVIVIHGLSRDAGHYFQTLQGAAAQAGIDEQTLIVAPHFQCDGDPIASGDARWLCDGAENWAHGGRDESDSAAAVYSFGALDRLVAAAADRSRFPNLQRIVVTGLSAGGQMTQRYAALNAIDPGVGVPVEYVVLSPSSYLYFDDDRLADGATCQASGGCSGAFTPFWGASSCPDYDDYPYGLDARSGYVAQPAAPQALAQYLARDVRYFVGSEDTLANAAGTNLDTSCSANAQGVDRVARAIEYWNELRMQYQSQQPLVVVPGCEHSRPCMYESLEVRAAVFPAAPAGVSSDLSPADLSPTE